MNFESISLIFNHTQSQRLPEEAVPSYMTHEREEWSDTIIRIGKCIWLQSDIAAKINRSNRLEIYRLIRLQNLLKLTVLQNKSRKFNEWLFEPNHYAGRWHKKNMLRDFQAS